MKAGEKRERLWQNSIKLHEGLRARGFELATDKPESAIVALVMRDMEHGVRLWEALLDAGIYVNLARPPATPEGMTLLRCSLCAEHTSEQVEIVLDRFAAAKAAIEA
jgi:glycine C-acetyltransferase/8-amino-7-oxononanoate synthase